MLRPLRPEDAAALHRLVNDWEVAKTLARVPFPYPRDLADDWIASTWAQIAAGRGLAPGDHRRGRRGAEHLVGCVGLTLDARRPDGRAGLLARPPLLGAWRGARGGRAALPLGAGQPRHRRHPGQRAEATIRAPPRCCARIGLPRRRGRGCRPSSRAAGRCRCCCSRRPGGHHRRCRAGLGRSAHGRARPRRQTDAAGRRRAR